MKQVSTVVTSGLNGKRTVKVAIEQKLCASDQAQTAVESAVGKEASDQTHIRVESAVGKGASGETHIKTNKTLSAPPQVEGPNISPHSLT